MLQDGIQLFGESFAENFTIENGAALPTTGNNQGELFFLTTGDKGLYVYDGTDWEKAGKVDLTSGMISTALGYTPAALSGGKLLASQVPAIAITDTFVVASQAAMLALSSAELGDVAVRTDLNKSFILKAAGASTLANWQELLTPTEVVTSVNGQTGTVSLSTANIAEVTNQYFTQARARSAISLTAGSSGATYNSSTGVLDLSALTSGGGGLPTQTGALVNSALVTNGSVASWVQVGYLVLPRTATFDAAAKGKRIAVTAGFTIPAATYAAGDCFSFYNDSGAAITITQGSGLTLRHDGTANTGNRTLAQRGSCFVWFNTSNEAIINGSIT